MTKTWKDYLFVGVQFILFGLFAIDFQSEVQVPQLIKIIGLLASIVGVGILLISVLQLNRNLTAFPTPKLESELITTGLYRFSRHPIYSGLILFTLGYSVFTASLFRLIIAFILLFWFYLKTNYEEQKLQEKYSNYKEYQKKVNRFFPKIKKPQT